jgi:hypothetical protein
MTGDFHPNDAYCLELFPELLEQFSADELRSASTVGTYIFHEDYFAEFIAARSSNEAILRRIANYIEHLAGADDPALRTLAEVAILEGLVSRQDHRVAPLLGPASRDALARVLPRFSVDAKPWLKTFKH